MSELGRAIRNAAVLAQAAQKPADVLHGSVLSVSPLTVSVSRKLVLTKEFLTVCEAVTELKLQIGEEEYTIRRGLQPGDRVVLARESGGQHFYIIDREVS